MATTINYSRFTGQPDSLGISQDPPPNERRSSIEQLNSIERSFQMMLAHPKGELAHPVRKHIEYAVHRRPFGPEEHFQLPDTVAAVPHYTGYVGDSYGEFPYKNSMAPHGFEPLTAPNLPTPGTESAAGAATAAAAAAAAAGGIFRHDNASDNTSVPALTPDLAGSASCSPGLAASPGDLPGDAAALAGFEQAPPCAPPGPPAAERESAQFMSAFQDSSSQDGSSEGSLSSFEDYSNVLQQIRSRDSPWRTDMPRLPSPHSAESPKVPIYESTFYDDNTENNILNDNTVNNIHGDNRGSLRFTSDVRESVLIPGKQTIGGLDLYPRWDQLKPRRAAIAPQYAADDSYNTSQDVEPLVPQYETARTQHIGTSRLRVPQLVQSQSQHGSKEGIFPPQVTSNGQPQLPLSTLWKRSDGIDQGGPLLAGMPSLPSFPRSESQVIVDAQPCDRWGRPECTLPVFAAVFVVFLLFPPFWLLLGAGYLDAVIGVVPRRAKQLSLVAGAGSFIAAVAIALALALA